MPTGSALYTFVGQSNFVASPVSPFYDYTLDVTDVALSGGITYWISIYSNDSPLNYAWANSGDGSPLAAINVFGEPFQTFNDQGRFNHVFSLQSDNVSAVPLPAAFPLLGAGLAGMVLVGSRRKRKTANAA